jgi:hypothetical protein
MMKEISVIIDGKKINVPEGTTVLRAAADNGIEELSCTVPADFVLSRLREYRSFYVLAQQSLMTV